MVVSPEFAGGADAGLDFIDNEQDIIPGGDFAERAKEGGGSVVVTAFGLDGLHDDSGDWVVKGLNATFGFGEAAGFFFGVFALVTIKGIEKMREGSLGPVEGGNVEFMNRLAASGGQGAKQTAVES